MRLVGDRRAHLFYLCHDRIHLSFARDIVAERTRSRASRPQRDLGLMDDRFAMPDGQLQAAFKIKEGDSAMLELPADDSPRRQTEPVAIILQRPLQIVDTESNNGDAWLHSRTSAPL